MEERIILKLDGDSSGAERALSQVERALDPLRQKLDLVAKAARPIGAIRGRGATRCAPPPSRSVRRRFRPDERVWGDEGRAREECAQRPCGRRPRAARGVCPAESGGLRLGGEDESHAAILVTTRAAPHRPFGKSPG